MNKSSDLKLQCQTSFDEDIAQNFDNDIFNLEIAVKDCLILKNS